MAKQSLLGISRMAATPRTAPRVRPGGGKGLSNPFGKLKPSTVGSLALGLGGVVVIALVIALASGGSDGDMAATSIDTANIDPEAPAGFGVEASPQPALHPGAPGADTVSLEPPDPTNGGDGEMFSTAMPATRTHTVEPGQALSQISLIYYGSSQKWQEIADANGIGDPNSVREGTVLTIPTLAGTPSVANTGPTAGNSPVSASVMPPPTSSAERRSGEEALRRGPVISLPVGTALQAEQGPDVPEQIHRFSTGDSFFTLASHYYGDISHYMLIANANPGVARISNLEPGTPIVIPALSYSGSGASSVAAPSGGTPVATSVGNGTTYVVQDDDTLSGISLKVYGTSRQWPRIARANGLTETSPIFPGNVLTIPAR